MLYRISKSIKLLLFFSMCKERERETDLNKGKIVPEEATEKQYPWMKTRVTDGREAKT